MRLAIAFALFLGVHDLASSAPHAYSEALLQELRNALNVKESSIQQQRNTETLAILCEPTATGFARVPTSQTPSSNEMVRAQEVVFVFATIGVPLTLPDPQSDWPPGDRSFILVQSNKEATLQEIKNLNVDILRPVVIVQPLAIIGLPLPKPTIDWPPVQSKEEATLQEIKYLLSHEKTSLRIQPARQRHNALSSEQ